MLRKRLGFMGLVLLVSLIWVLPTMADDLNDLQKQKLGKAQHALKQVSVNLQLAQSSAGSGTAQPTGSKAKLTKIRLDSAIANVPAVQQWLADLPAEQADVAAVKAALADAENAIAALEQRLKGEPPTPSPAPQPPTEPNPAAAGNSSTPTPGAAPNSTPQPRADATPMPASNPPAAAEEKSATVKMGYQQVDLLKAAAFNLREVESGTATLAKLLEELKPVKDQLTINHRQVAAAMNTIENAKRKSGFTQDGLNKLPANGEGVAEVVQRLATANSQIAAAVEFLTPLHQKLTALIDPANYPEYNSDVKRLGELSVMYNNPTVFQTDRPRAGQVLAEADAAKAEVVRIAKTYTRLMEQKTEEGKRVEGSGNNFLQKLDVFMKAGEREKQDLPAQIRDDLVKINQTAEDAVARQKPLYFTGGIPQMMEAAKQKLDLFVVLDPEHAPEIQKEFNQVTNSLKEKAKSLEQLIINENQLPPDRYQGNDRKQVVAVAVDAWKHQQADFDVLTSRIPSDNWARETMWQYSNGTWYFVDRSKLQVQLIVADKAKNELAIIRPVTIIKDHQKGDSLIGTPMYSGDDELQPSAYLLRAKVK